MIEKNSLFNQMYDEVHDFKNVMIHLITKRLEKHGIELSQKQIDHLEKKLLEEDFDKLEINFDQSQLELIQDDNIIDDLLDFSNCDDELDEVHNEIDENLKEKLPEIVNFLAKELAVLFKQDSQRMLKLKREEISYFNNRLLEEWKKPIDLFETFIEICSELGEMCNLENNNEAQKNENYVFYVLVRLHARACQIANEILVLIKNGFADGAMARWRSLHEIAVVSEVIKKYGNDLAEKYLLHEVVESYKAMHRYDEYADRLKVEPYTDMDYKDINKKYNDLLNRFGKNFKYDYGWASEKLNIAKPNIYDLEKHVKLDHHRPFYQMASHNVHANSKSINFKLGALSDDSSLLLGPTNYGFTDPADSCSISLSIITNNFLSLYPNFDNMIALKVIRIFQSEIGEEFLKVQLQIEEYCKNEENE